VATQESRVKRTHPKLERRDDAGAFDRLVDVASMDSFPASDPPALGVGRFAAPHPILVKENRTGERDMNVLYTAAARVTGGRTGRGETEDGKLKVNLAKPRELGGDDSGTNPEQLFAIGYAACFGGAVELVARRSKLNAADLSIRSRVSLGKTPEDAFQLGVEMELRLPNMTREEAERVVQEAHQVCPYSRATRGNIEVVLRVAD
jgi:lipoyl-dependent peroxiredoxin